MQNLVSSERAALASASFLFKRAISLESLPSGLAGLSSATKLLVNQLQELCSDPFRLDLQRSEHGTTTVLLQSPQSGTPRSCSLHFHSLKGDPQIDGHAAQRPSIT
jgi:hypothetical protein